MKINEQVLSRKQMAHLRELGINTSDASLCWRWSNEDGGWVLGFMNSLLQEICNPPHRKGPFPAYTIGDLIEKLPKRNDEGSRFDISLSNKTFSYVYTDIFVYYGEYNNLIDGLYNCLCWVAENHKELIIT